MPTSTMKEDSNSNNKSQIVVQTFGILAVVFLVEGFIQYWRTNQIQQLNYEIQDLKSRIEMIEYLDVDGRSVKVNKKKINRFDQENLNFNFHFRVQKSFLVNNT